MKSLLQTIPALFLLLGAPVIYAQDPVASTPSTSATVSATSSAPAQTWTITVGKADHKFVPDVTEANAGDIIEFQFFPTNHSVVRAEYGYPCIPYEKTGRGKVGFFAGFHPVDAILDDPPSWQVKINDTDPIFFYCSAPGSCIGYGMVGVINPNATTSLAKQKQEAKDSTFMLQPGQDFPDEANASSDASATTTPTAAYTEYVTPTLTPTPATATPTPTPEPQHKTGLGTGAIAGIAVGGAIALGLAIAVFYLLGRQKSLKQALNRGDTTAAGSQQPPPPPSSGPQMRTSNVPGYSTVSGQDIPPYSYASGGYPEVPLYPKPYAHQNIDEVFPATPGSDIANKIPHRWSQDPTYRGTSPPPPGSPYLNMNNLEQARMVQNASPSAMSDRPLDQGQMSPTRPSNRPPVELAAHQTSPTALRSQEPEQEQDVKFHHR